MERRELLDLAERVLRLPTAPYHEQHVKAFVVDFCRELPGLRVEEDRVGNVIVKYQPQARASVPSSRQRPLVFVAHMDHPGFEMLGGNRAEFLGGVPKEMFARGVGVRVYSDLWEGLSRTDRLKSRPEGRSHIKATIRQFNATAWPKRKLVTLNLEPGTMNRPRRGDFGMWDVPAFRVAGNQLHATAIDDVLGTVVMLATLVELIRQQPRTHVWCAFTRAEEVGFQ
jgi:hypothetical protein